MKLEYILKTMIMNTKILCVWIALLTCQIAGAQTKNVTWGDQGNGTYINPILNADYSDPDVIRVGDKYYMVNSDFHYMGMPVLESDDMINWTDHGEILSSDQVPWGRKEGGFMWAPDCAYRNDTYYFYFPHPSETDWNDSWKIGVATSDKPAEGFKVQGYIEGMDPMIDPCVFVDDDGQAYIYNGGGGTCKGGKLKDNMIELDGPMRTMEGLSDFHEATWIHKYNGKYYLSYSDNHDDGEKHNRMCYAISDSPLGPWEYKGIYMEPTDSYTNHGSIVEFKGQWYSFYHNSALSGHDWLRSICVDKLYYNPDGTIKMVKQTK